MSGTMEISFVIPCHNEAVNPPPLVAAIVAGFWPLQKDYEIVITGTIAARTIRGRC